MQLFVNFLTYLSKFPTLALHGYMLMPQHLANLCLNFVGSSVAERSSARSISLLSFQALFSRGKLASPNERRAKERPTAPRECSSFEHRTIIPRPQPPPPYHASTSTLHFYDKLWKLCYLLYSTNNQLYLPSGDSLTSRSGLVSSPLSQENFWHHVQISKDSLFLT